MHSGDTFSDESSPLHFYRTHLHSLQRTTSASEIRLGPSGHAPKSPPIRHQKTHCLAAVPLAEAVLSVREGTNVPCGASFDPLHYCVAWGFRPSSLLTARERPQTSDICRLQWRSKHSRISEPPRTRGIASILRKCSHASLTSVLSMATIKRRRTSTCFVKAAAIVV